MVATKPWSMVLKGKPNWAHFTLKMDVIGIDGLSCELPVLLHDVVPVVSELKVVVWVGCGEHVLI